MPNELTVKEPRLTMKQRKFLKLYFETGNGTKSAMQAYGLTDYSTAGAIASENLKKLKNPIKTFLEHNDISLGSLTLVLFEATKATKRDQFSGEMYPDHKSRIAAVDRLSKWLGMESDPAPAQQTNIQINFDKYEMEAEE